MSLVFLQNSQATTAIDIHRRFGGVFFGNFPAVTVTISDDHNFDRQIIIPPIIFNGIAYDDPGSGNNPGGTRYTGYGFEVRKNGVLIASRETKGAIPGSYSAVIDMPSGGGSVTLEFKIFQKGNQGAGNITDCTVIVTKKAASGISIR